MTHLLTSLRNPRKEGERFFKFLIVGAVGFVVDAGTLFVCTSLLIIPDLIAQAVSFAAAVTSNFTWNRYWTYPESRSKPLSRQYAQFFILNLIALLVRTLIFDALDEPLIALAAASLDGPLGVIARFAVDTLNMTVEQLGNNLALACAVVTMMLWNFFTNRFITYSDVKFGH